MRQTAQQQMEQSVHDIAVAWSLAFIGEQVMPLLARIRALGLEQREDLSRIVLWILRQIQLLARSSSQHHLRRYDTQGRPKETPA